MRLSTLSAQKGQEGQFNDDDSMAELDTSGNGGKYQSCKCIMCSIQALNLSTQALGEML